MARPRHRGRTFKPGTLGRFVMKHGVVLNALQVPAFMICRKEDPGEKHFILTLKNRQGNLLKIPYSQGADVEGLPEVESTLDMLAADARLYFEYGTAAEYCAAFGRDEWDCHENFAILESLANSTIKFLGPEGFEELMALVSDETYRLEGDRRWWRRQTCG